MIQELFIFALIFTASAITPGPDTMTIFGRALSGGKAAAIPFAIGVILAKLTLLTLVILGLAALAQSFENLFVILKFVGALYLIGSGIRTWRKSGEAEAHQLSKNVTWKDSITGYMLGISNPHAIAFYVALLPTVIDMQKLNLATYLTLCAVLVCIMFMIATIYAVSAERLRFLLKSIKGRKRLNRVAGGVMIGSGVLVATR